MKWWQRRWLRWVIGVVVALVVAGYVALRVLTPTHADDAAVAAAMRAQAQLTGAAKTYAATCAYCHDRQIGPDLHGRQIAPAAIVIIVRQGMGAMPALLPGQLSDQQLQALAQYVSTLPAQQGD